MADPNVSENFGKVDNLGNLVKQRLMVDGRGGGEYRKV